MRDANPSFHLLRKRQRGKVIALGLYHQTNRLPGMNIERPPLYQIGVHRRIKPAVVDDVVHMSINIVI